MNSKVQFVDITESQQGQRIDNFLIKTLKNLPRSRLYRIIRKGEVRVNKKRIKPEYKLCPGDRVRIPPIQLQTDENTPVTISGDLLEKVNSRIIFEDDSIIILNKPSGLAVHSGSGLRFGAIDVLRKLRQESEIELIHRLDRDTSGCLLFAKHRQSLLAMQKLFKSHQLQKNYLAIVKGHWDQSVTEIKLPLLKKTMSNGERKVFIDEAGKPAHTVFEQVTHFSRQGVRYSLLQIRLLTGRTHQIRVHCKSQHHEIAGDSKYGDRNFNKEIKKMAGSRLLLHASKLEFPQNAHTKCLQINAPVPQVISSLIG